VRYQGNFFEPVAGPIRADIIDTSQLSPTGLVFDDWGLELKKSNDGRLVYAISGVPLSKGFLIRSGSSSVFGIPDNMVTTSNLIYPAAQLGVGCEIYAVPGASPIQGRFIWSPPPTITSATVISLSSKGLLSIGWPHVDLERRRLEYRGLIYDFIAGGYINELKNDTSISPIILEEVEILDIQYKVHVGQIPYPALAKLVSDHVVNDRVRIYKFKDRPVSDAILVDQTPSDLIGYQFVYFQLVNK
jgi:hypothetical protein